MSRVYEALKRSQAEARESQVCPEIPTANQPAAVVEQPPELDAAPSLVSSPAADKCLATMTDEHGFAAEKFRILGNRLANLRDERELKIIHVTSSIMGEGKSMVSANLALTLAARPKARVLLVEGDLRKPTLSHVFSIEKCPGLGEWWESNAVTPPLFRINDRRLWLLAAGTVTHPAEILQSRRLPDLLARLAAWFDWVVIDSPPLISLVDANLWSRWADGSLLVVREGVTPRKALRRGLESLDNPKIIGIVMNEVAENERVPYYNQYYGVAKADGQRLG